MFNITSGFFKAKDVSELFLFVKSLGGDLIFKEDSILFRENEIMNCMTVKINIPICPELVVTTYGDKLKAVNPIIRIADFIAKNQEVSIAIKKIASRYKDRYTIIVDSESEKYIV